METRNNQIDERTINGYSNEYSEASFWSKILGCACKAGKKVVRMALELYYAYTEGNLTTWEKAMVLGALGYLISPFDLVPDAIPVLGYADDMGALKFAYEKVSGAITESVKEKARRKCDSIFG